MNVIEVIPFVRGTAAGSLTYYASEEYAPGTLLSIPVRNTMVRGMVVSSQPVSAAKTALRAATFSLRKLPPQEQVTQLPAVLIETANALMRTLPATSGAILFSLLPPEIREGRYELHTPSGKHENIGSPQTWLLEAPIAERYRSYRSRIREAFAHRGTVLFVVPTSADVERAHEELSPGIADRVVMFSPLFGTKKLERAYEAFRDLGHAKLVITTPRHAFLYRHDLTTIIVEQARSQFYKSRIRPYEDTCESLRTYARIGGCNVIFGDLLPLAEHEYLRRNDFFLTEGEHPKRMLFPGTVKFIVQNDKPTAESPFKLFSKQLLNMLEKAESNRENIFLLAARRGLAPVVTCADCGHIFRCPDSGRPYSLLKTVRNGEEQRWFVSSTSGTRVRAADVCSACGSWRLRERGIGIQHIYDELLKIVDPSKIVLFDHTTASTYTKARRLMSTFTETKGSILLATPMVLPYIEKDVTHSAIVSFDATRSIPSWRADEEVLSLILRLRELTKGMVLIQSRTQADQLVEYAERGTVDQFYTDEIELRELLSYPPFATLIHFSFNKSSAENLESLIQTTAAPHKVHFYHSFGSGNDVAVRNGLMRVARNSVPDQGLMDRLRTLPPEIRIEVNPLRIV